MFLACRAPTENLAYVWGCALVLVLTVCHLTKLENQLISCIHKFSLSVCVCMGDNTFKKHGECPMGGAYYVSELISHGIV